MKRIFPILALLCLCSFAQAAYVTITVTVSNAPAIGDTFTRNGTTVTFTNAPLNNTTWIVTNAQAATTTNLWRHLGANMPAWYSRMTTSTNLTLSGSDAQFSITGGWATLTTNSASTTNFHAILVPWDTQPYATNRTNDANELFYGLKLYSSTGNRATFFSNEVYTAPWIRDGSVSNSVLTNIPRALITNAELLTATIRAGVASNVTLTNIPALNGYLTGLTNGSLHNVQITNSPFITVTNFKALGGGYLTNVALDRVSLTNAVFSGGTLTGTVFTVTGSGLGTWLTVESSSTTASLGPAIHFQRYDGTTNQAEINDVLMHLIAGGYGETAMLAAGRIRAFANTNFTDANAPGRFEIETTPVGSVTTVVRMRVDEGGVYITNGNLHTSGSITNPTITGTNRISARLDYVPRSNSSLADGFNSGIVLGSNVYVRISGPSGAYTNAGFVAEQDGSFHILQFDNPVNSMEIRDNSGLEATPENRIRTGTGGNLHFTNNPVILPVIYDAGSSVWRILAGMPYR